jgi:hypothetical protein
VSASHVAPMIVVAAITKIKIPIANAILTAPTSAALIALILPQIRVKPATPLAKLRRLANFWQTSTNAVVGQPGLGMPLIALARSGLPQSLDPLSMMASAVGALLDRSAVACPLHPKSCSIAATSNSGATFNLPFVTILPN